MNRALEELVWQRAGRACEYCRLPFEFAQVTFEVDRITALSHGGRTRASNLCLACFHCNSFKGPNLAGIDPRTGRVVRLFNPRRHQWHWHFRWQGAELLGRTPIGRATVATLRVNQPDRVYLRQELLAEGVFPPAD